MILTIREIADALGVPYSGNGFITSLETDSRAVTENSCFAAIKGERVDGHDYINTALSQGASLILATRTGDYRDRDKVLMVPDILDAILTISRLYREKMNCRLVGITGSVGKTTTKEFVATVLEKNFKITKTIGNQNNEIGLPKTLLSIQPETEITVAEMGMSDLGEIRALSSAAHPMMGVITNIGVSHIERLGSRENILKAKLELAEALPDGSTLFVCSDNDLLKNLAIDRLHVVNYGLDHQHAELYATIVSSDVTTTNFIIHWNDKAYRATIPGTGDHLVLDALVAFGVGVSFGMKPETAIEALKEYIPSGQRQKVVEFSNMVVVEDCYNASPDSMKAAVRTLGQYPAEGRRILVMGDMLELGDISVSSHMEIGNWAVQCGVSEILACGEASRYAVDAAKAGGLADSMHFSSRDNLSSYLVSHLNKGDVVWVKASHSMGLEKVIQYLYEHFGSGEDA